MKRWITILLSITTALSLNACSSSKQSVDETLPTNTVIEADESTVTTQPKPGMFIDTEFYTLLAPSSWKNDCFYEIADGESYNYTLSFYDKASHDHH